MTAIIVIIAVFLLVAVGALFSITSKKDRENDGRKTNVTHAPIEEKPILSEQEQRHERNKQILSRLTDSYGSPGKIVSPRNDTEFSFIDFPDSRIIYCDKAVYEYDIIESCVIKDKSNSSPSVQYSETKHDVGSVLGRAALGGILAGPAGAIVGGLTSKQTTTTSVYMNTQPHHYYAIIKITTNNQPIIKNCGTNRLDAERIQSVINRIVDERTKEETINTLSIADEITKLADLKDRGLLTKTEFEQQKQKLLNA